MKSFTTTKRYFLDNKRQGEIWLIESIRIESLLNVPDKRAMFWPLATVFFKGFDFYNV